MPSQKILEQKTAAVEALSEKLGRAASGVLVKYQGITVEQDTKLRAALRGAGVEYAVIKNTMIGRACEKAGLTGMEQYLEGMNALAISYDDPVAPAKILKEYADKIETFELRAGFLDGAVVDVNTVNELAEIPQKEVLLARMLGSLTGPLSGLAVALQAIIDKSGEEVPAEEAAPAAEEAAEAPAAE
ncbi:MAG: 50S ribosomal protein L10 [Clostridia bacterium]|nr:50S ribosomal protein L10 [Clostridia bacterium]